VLAVVVQTSFGFKEISSMGSMLEGFKVQVPTVPMPGERDAFDSPFLGSSPSGGGTQLNLENLHNGIVFFVFFVVV